MPLSRRGFLTKFPSKLRFSVKFQGSTFRANYCSLDDGTGLPSSLLAVGSCFFLYSPTFPLLTPTSDETSLLLIRLRVFGWFLPIFRPPSSFGKPKLHQGDAENGVPPDPVYLRRSTVCKWLYLMGFLSDDIKRAPDDPEQLAELISGRARLKHQTK